MQTVFPNLRSQYLDPEYNMSSRCILAPKNTIVDTINDMCLNQLPGDAIELLSVDSLDERQGHGGDSIPIENVHAVTPPGFPPHRLRAKPGVPLIVLVPIVVMTPDRR